MLRGLLRCQQSSLGFFGAGTFDGSDLCVIQCPIVFGGVGMADQGAGEVRAVIECIPHIRNAIRDHGCICERCAVLESRMHIRNSIRNCGGLCYVRAAAKCIRHIRNAIRNCGCRYKRFATFESSLHTRNAIWNCRCIYEMCPTGESAVHVRDAIRNYGCRHERMATVESAIHVRDTIRNCRRLNHISAVYEGPGKACDILIANVRPNGAISSFGFCLLYTSPSPRDAGASRMPSSA